MRSFTAKTPHNLPERVVCLPVIGIRFMSEVLARLHFGFFHRERRGLSRLCVPRKQRVGFVMKPCLVGYVLCSNRIFHLLVRPRGYFFAIIRHTESFPSAYPSSRWNYSCFKQPPLHLRCALREFSKQGRYAVRKGLSYIFVCQGLLLRVWQDLLVQHVCVSPYVFFQMQVADQQVVISRQYCTPFETMQKSVNDRWPKESLH